MEPSSKLPGVTLKRFQEALVAAFPSRDDLAQMVREGLDENLDVIVALGEVLEKVLADA